MATAKKKTATVVVCANLLQDQMFRLPDGRVITLKGVKSSHLMDPDGKPLLGQYGRTVLRTDDWDALVKRYGSMGIFQKGLVFAEPDAASADDAAADRSELRNGLEPVNVDTDAKLASSPADKQPGA